MTKFSAPFFSIILTTYNRAYCIEKTINSIINQRFQSFEIIVIDDCSNDDTEKIIRNYDLRYYKTSSNSGGPAVPRNIGIKHSRGDWICFCDSDDLYLVFHLEIIKKCIEEINYDEIIFSTNAFTKNIEGKYSKLYFPRKKIYLTNVSFTSNFLSNKCILSTLCVRNKYLVNFKEEVKYQSFEDYLFLLENILNGKKHLYINSGSVYYNNDSKDSIRFQSKTELDILNAKTKILIRSKKVYYLFYLILFLKVKILLKSILRKNN